MADLRIGSRLRFKQGRMAEDSASPRAGTARIVPLVQEDAMMRLVSTLPGAAVRRAKVLPALHTLIRSLSIANAAKIDEPNALDFHFRVGRTYKNCST